MKGGNAALDRANVHVGTSGWSYDHWRGAFYPEDLPHTRWLEHYAAHFTTVEINNSFYQLPTRHTMAVWRESVPPKFLFSMKASRYITHMRKLNDPREGLRRLMACARVLGEKLGPILFQLPPRWHLNRDRLAGFLRALPRGQRYTFEFRDPSWFDAGVYDLLAEHNAAFCIFDLERKLSPLELTADFVYIRLHGPNGAYQGSYAGPTLARWARDIAAWRRDGREVFCYFDNDQAGYAARDALRLKRLLAKEMPAAKAGRGR